MSFDIQSVRMNGGKDMTFLFLFLHSGTRHDIPESGKGHDFAKRNVMFFLRREQRHDISESWNAHDLAARNVMSFLLNKNSNT